MIQQKKYQKHPVNPAQIKRQLAGAVRRLKAAETVVDEDEEAAYELAYEAMLKASIALMYSCGKRARSIPGHHVAIIEMAGEVLGPGFREQMIVFDEMRRNRNNFMYDAEGFVTDTEARQAIKIAKKYVQGVCSQLKTGVIK